MLIGSFLFLGATALHEGGLRDKEGKGSKKRKVFNWKFDPPQLFTAQLYLRSHPFMKVMTLEIIAVKH